MTGKKTLNPEEITDLLSKLKNETPDYPSDMMAARKAAFLKQAVNIKIDTKGQGGEGGQQGGSGGSGTALGGGTAAPGMLLQALIGISVVAAMFLAAYAYRDQLTDAFGGDEIAVQENTSQAVPISSPLAPVTSSEAPISPEFDVPEIVPTNTPAVLAEVDSSGETNISGITVIEETPGAESASDEIKTNNGLHLGQTPGTPAAPGQGNPGNPNQPDKTKPDKPDKPDKPGKPDKPNK